MKKVVKIVIIVIVLWIVIFAVDWFAVTAMERVPVFCIGNREGNHFVGLGYSYDCGVNSLSGKFEYCQYIFGIATKATFTN